MNYLVSGGKTILAVMLASLISLPVIAQPSIDLSELGIEMGGSEKSEAKSPSKGKKTKKFEDVIKPCRKIEGLFTLYQDTTNGSMYMRIGADQIGKEYIYFSHIADGNPLAGSFRGSYGDNTIFKVKKYFNKIELETQNLDFYFDPDNALARSKDANVSPALLLSEKIAGQDSLETEYLIKADGLFLSEVLTQIKPSYGPISIPGMFKLGSLSKGKTKYREVNNYPENTDVVVEYVFDNKSARGGGPGLTDSRYVTIVAQHSFIQVPDNDYKPRYDDPRVGYFLTQVNDMTSQAATPYRDMIHRWHLVKKNPDADLSEPVEPITWWIENTTPIEFRETIKQAILNWNKAFEQAGFKNAMVAKVQPDDAEWDAGDMRYNVLRWTSSPLPPFGGYGPSFVDPRTGQILGADIMLEYVYFTNRVKYEDLFEGSVMSLEEELLAADKALELDQSKLCFAGINMQHNLMLGKALLRAEGATADDMEGLLKEGLLELVMHELGHTLGLNHNMKASQMLSPEELRNKEITAVKGNSASVMDYTAINVSRDREEQGHYYTTTVGPYDIWAIEYGYKPATSEELEEILARSTEHDLAFGNDADDMRSPGKAMDPRVNVGDMSSDAIGYARERFGLVSDLMPKLKDQYTAEGESYHELRTAYNILFGQARTAGNVVSRYIGGVYVERAMAGQEGETQPFTPVPIARQKEAMNLLRDYVFAPDAFQGPTQLYNFLQYQRRGFGFFGGPEDPKIHQQVIGAQRGVLAHITHPRTLQRIVDSHLYGNGYDLAEMMTDLNNAVFAADAGGTVNTFRQNLQVHYTERLIGMVSGKTRNRYCHQAQSMALANLKSIRKIAKSKSGDALTQAHRAHLAVLIDAALKS